MRVARRYRTRGHVRVFDIGSEGHLGPARVREVRGDLAAPAARARCHRPPAARDAGVRRDAPVAKARRHRAHPGRGIPRRGAGRGPPPAHQAIRRELRRQPQARRAHLAGHLRPVAGLHVRVPGSARGSAAADAESPMEDHAAAAVRAARALLRHGREAPRVPLRAVDPCEVDGAPPHVPARVRARHGPRARGPARRRAQRDALDGRAGVPARPAHPPAQHGQHVAAPARLGDVAASRVEPAARARCRAALARGLLRRHRRQDRPRAPPATIPDR